MKVIQDKHSLSNDVRAMVKGAKRAKHFSSWKKTPEPEEESVSVEFHIGEREISRIAKKMIVRIMC